MCGMPRQLLPMGLRDESGPIWHLLGAHARQRLQLEALGAARLSAHTLQRGLRQPSRVRAVRVEGILSLLQVALQGVRSSLVPVHGPLPTQL